MTILIVSIILFFFGLFLCLVLDSDRKREKVTMQKELLIFIVLVAIIAALFNFTATPKEATSSGQLNNNDKIVYNAGETFKLTLDASQTTDSSLKSKSRLNPYSEDWDDYGTDNCPDMWEDGMGKCFDGYDQSNGTLEPSEKEAMILANASWDTAKKSDPNGDNWRDCNENRSVCSGDSAWNDSMGNGSWNDGEGLDQNRQWDEGEKVYDVDNNGTYTESLLTFAWFKVEEVKNPKNGKDLRYIGLDGHTLNSDACSVRDFINNNCTNENLMVECGGSKAWKDSKGMTRIFYAPDCEDFVARNEKNDNKRIPWVLEYEGDDMGSLDINLKVLDYGSYYVNGDNKLMTRDEKFSFDCTRIKEEGPNLGTKVTYKPVANISTK